MSQASCMNHWNQTIWKITCDSALNFEGQNSEADLNNAGISEVCLRNHVIEWQKQLVKICQVTSISNFLCRVWALWKSPLLLDSRVCGATISPGTNRGNSGWVDGRAVGRQEGVKHNFSFHRDIGNTDQAKHLKHCLFLPHQSKEGVVALLHRIQSTTGPSFEGKKITSSVYQTNRHVLVPKAHHVAQYIPHPPKTKTSPRKHLAAEKNGITHTSFAFKKR